MQNQRRPQQPQPRKPQATRNAPAQRPPQRRPQTSRPMQARPSTNYRRRNNKPKKLWIIIGAAVLLLILLLLIFGGGDNQDATSQPPVGATTEANGADTTQQSAQVFPIVVYDSNNVKITMTGFDPDGMMGTEIAYTFENNSAIPVMLGVGDAYIDGWQITTLGGETLPAGMKANGTIYLSDTELEQSGITDITSITLKDCHIYNDETYDTIDTFDIVLNLK